MNIRNPVGEPLTVLPTATLGEVLSALSGPRPGPVAYMLREHPMPAFLRTANVHNQGLLHPADFQRFHTQQLRQPCYVHWDRPESIVNGQVIGYIALADERADYRDAPEPDPSGRMPLDFPMKLWRDDLWTIAMLDLPRGPGKMLSGVEMAQAYTEYVAYFYRMVQSKAWPDYERAVALREEGGHEVRIAWIRWAQRQPEDVQRAHPSWFTEWRDLSEHEKEADRVIFEHLVAWMAQQPSRPDQLHLLLDSLADYRRAMTEE